MKKNLSDYVILNKGAIPEDLCNRTIKELEESPNWRQHTFTRYEKDKLAQVTSDADPMQHDADFLAVIPELMEIYWKTIYKYVAEDTGFKWFPSWQGFDSLKFVQYNPKTEMRKHCDHIHSMFDGQKKGVPILTLVAQLNDDFKGGEFILFDDEVIDFGKGDILVFPSSFLFPHEVKRITEGVRYSASTWVF